MHLRASYAFTELTNVFAGLNAGMLCSGIMIVVFFEMSFTISALVITIVVYLFVYLLHVDLNLRAKLYFYLDI